MVSTNFIASTPSSKTPYNVSFEQFVIHLEVANEHDFHKLDWKAISSMKYLSEHFMEKYRHKLNWSVLCNTQPMNELFIRRMSDFIDFKVLSNTQMGNVSVQFICEYKNRLNMDIINAKNIVEKKLSIGNISSVYESYKDAIEFDRLTNK